MSPVHAILCPTVRRTPKVEMRKRQGLILSLKTGIFRAGAEEHVGQSEIH